MTDVLPPEVTGFFDQRTWTITSVVKAPRSLACVVVDPVMDYDRRNGKVSCRSVDALAAFIARNQLTVEWIVDTHVHADHMTGMAELQRRVGGRTAIGAQVATVQKTFAGIFNLPGFPDDGRQYDRLLDDGDSLTLDGLTLTALHVPGHTPACMAYVVGDAVFVGDTLFMPDFGTARCDFPGGDAATLYRSIRRLLALPPSTRMFVGHDYGTKDRGIAWETTVAAQRDGNIHVGRGIGEAEFVARRHARDATLDFPELLFQSLQVNIRAGKLPEPEDNGVSYLKFPLSF